MTAKSMRFVAFSAAAGLLATSAIAIRPAQAAPPDINKFCRKHFDDNKGSRTIAPPADGSTPRFCINGRGTPGAKGWRGVQALIDFAVACQESTGSPEFRYVDGWKIECGRGPRPMVAEGPGVHIVQGKDLAKYCSEWIGPGATPQYSPAHKRFVCAGGTLPGPKPHTINLAIACFLAYKTHKVRYVKGKDRIYMACVE